MPLNRPLLALRTSARVPNANTCKNTAHAHADTLDRLRVLSLYVAAVGGDDDREGCGQMVLHTRPLGVRRLLTHICRQIGCGWCVARSRRARSNRCRAVRPQETRSARLSAACAIVRHRRTRGMFQLKRNWIDDRTSADLVDVVVVADDVPRSGSCAITVKPAFSLTRLKWRKKCACALCGKPRECT